MIDHKPIIGLAGGVGSGKSRVAAEMAKLGALVIDSDHLSQQELETQEVKKVLREWFGPSVFTQDGSVDRQRLAAVIFGDSAQRLRVERLLHPRVARRRAELIERALADDSVAAVVLDSPLLFEVDLNLQCDAVVFVDAAKSTRLERVARSRGWTVQELERREKWHKTLDFKKDRSDYTIDNDSSIDTLCRQVEKTFSKVISSVPAAKTPRGTCGADLGASDT